jgi:hypothetical protein
LIYGQVAFGRRSIVFEGVQKVFGTLDLFVSLLETEIKYPILQGGILPFWTPSFYDLENQISIPIIFLNS